MLHPEGAPLDAPEEMVFHLEHLNGIAVVRDDALEVGAAAADEHELDGNDYKDDGYGSEESGPVGLSQNVRPAGNEREDDRCGGAAITYEQVAVLVLDGALVGREVDEGRVLRGVICLYGRMTSRGFSRTIAI
uniref:Uncharacterized protein n=1 Tax=uncultured bacterium Contigcl_1738 TaxID=1393655 RepID=W0FSH8_9BACT|nr:hypothetical protein [uncultured bacterium Contigcl_1738]